MGKKPNNIIISISHTNNKETNAYCSLASELRDYKLVELIRKSDYTGTKTNEYINNSFLFKILNCAF